MADRTPPVEPDPENIRFEGDRVAVFLSTLERIAAGKVELRVPISAHHDTLDAIAHGINVLVGELAWAGDRAREAQERQAAELRAVVANAEARGSAMLKAIPDLLFVLLRDGTFIDYYARDPKMLLVPPDAFLGRTIRDVMPPTVAEALMEGFERIRPHDDPVVVEYELVFDERRFYEARIVDVDAERLLSVVRDVTESKRAAALNHELAQRLISRQEVERQRIARDLHDDVGQRLALLNLEIEEMGRDIASEPVRARLRNLSVQASELASDVHHMSYELHPSSKLRTLGLVVALQSLCRDISKQRNLEVAFSHREIPPSLDADVSLCLYRIVQEALHNVARHSQARNAQVSVITDDGHIALQIADSGVGFDPRRISPSGLGLANMRERVAILNGLLAIDAVPGGGTRVGVRIPLVGDQSARAGGPG